MVLAVSTEATILTFTHEGSGSGSLADNPFLTSDFVITAVADTDDREIFLGGWSIQHISASISIDGLGEFDFLTGTGTYMSSIVSCIGFSRIEPGLGNSWDLLNGPVDTGFLTWDVLGPIGPITGQGILLQWDHSPGINTTGGILFFDDDDNVDVTFTVTPEPATILTLGLGAFVLRRKRS